MDLVRALSAIRAHLRLTAAGAVVAVFVAIAAAGLLPTAGPQSTGAGQARVLVDTPRPLAGDVQAFGIDTIGARSALLAELVASDRMKPLIARSAGLRASELTVIVPSMGSPRVSMPMPDRAAATATMSPAAHVLTVTTDARMPVITLRATAPDPAAAGRILAAATTTLASAARSPGGGETLVARPLGRADVTAIVSRGAPRRRLAVAAALLAFGAWCTAIVLADGAFGIRRLAAAGTTRTVG
jgi:hypothetical protein